MPLAVDIHLPAKLIGLESLVNDLAVTLLNEYSGEAEQQRACELATQFVMEQVTFYEGAASISKDAA